jgi:hypothetical protein
VGGSKRCNVHRKVDLSSAVGHADGHGSESRIGKKEVSLSRSHSDSYRRNRRLSNDDGLRQTASNDELQNLRVRNLKSSWFRGL